MVDAPGLVVEVRVAAHRPSAPEYSRHHAWLRRRSPSGATGRRPIVELVVGDEVADVAGLRYALPVLQPAQLRGADERRSGDLVQRPAAAQPPQLGPEPAAVQERALR